MRTPVSFCSGWQSIAASSGNDQRQSEVAKDLIRINAKFIPIKTLQLLLEGAKGQAGPVYPRGLSVNA